MVRTAPKTEVRATLSNADIGRLMVETECCFRTVQQWASGRSVKPATMSRLGRAAAKLGIEVRA